MPRDSDFIVPPLRPKKHSHRRPSSANPQAYKNDRPRVFLSSTCYDLVDLRATLDAMLSKAGFTILASDMAETKFSALGNVDSVETCVENVRSSDALLLVFDRRYGPRIPGRGDASATRAEYEGAITSGIPVITFARKEFLNDFRLYKRLIRDSKTPSQVARLLQHVSVSRYRSRYEFELLFEFFDSIRRVNSPGRNNWFDPFTDAVELSQLAAKRLKEILSTDIWHLQRALNVALLSKPRGQLDLTVTITQQALENLNRLQLTGNHLVALSESGLKNDIDISLFLSAMDTRTRDQFLSDRFGRLIAEPRHHKYISKHFSPAILRAAKKYVGQKGAEGLGRVLDCLGARRELISPPFRNTLHTMLQLPFPIQHLAERSNFHREECSNLHQHKIAGIKLISEFGDVRDIPHLFACLGDWDEPWATGDYEHELPCAAIICMKKLFERHVPGVLRILNAAVRHKELRPSTRVSSLRALLVCNGTLPAVEARSLAATLMADIANAALLAPLFADLQRAGISIEEELLLQQGNINISLAGLSWHATDKSIPRLLELLDVENFRSGDICRVLRFLITPCTRNTICSAARMRIEREIARRKESSHLTVLPIVEGLGISELLDYCQALKATLDARNSTALWQINRVIEAVHKTETARKAGLARADWSMTVFPVRSSEQAQQELRRRNEEIVWAQKISEE